MEINGILIRLECTRICDGNKLSANDANILQLALKASMARMKYVDEWTGESPMELELPAEAEFAKAMKDLK